jgi:hypothetical protein
MDPAAVPAVPDGLRLSEWIESRGVSRSTTYSLLRLAGIEPEARRVDGSRKPVSFLTAAQLVVMDAMAEQLRDGRTLAQLSAMVPTRTVRDDPGQDPEPSETIPDGSPDDPGLSRPLTLPERLQALQLALDTGAPLSTADVAQLLGARPGGPEVQRGRVLAVRHARNVWTLEAIE